MKCTYLSLNVLIFTDFVTLIEMYIYSINNNL